MLNGYVFASIEACFPKNWILHSIQESPSPWSQTHTHLYMSSQNTQMTERKEKKIKKNITNINVSSGILECRQCKKGIAISYLTNYVNKTNQCILYAMKQDRTNVSSCLYKKKSLQYQKKTSHFFLTCLWFLFYFATHF